jgi:hypothetical protein
VTLLPTNAAGVSVNEQSTPTRTGLAHAGIPCVVAPDEAAGAYPIDLSGGARVLVADADADDAAVILRDHAPTKEEHG